MPLVHVFDLGNVLLFVHEDLFFQRLRPRCRCGDRLEEKFNACYEEARVDRGGDFPAFYEAVVREIGLDMSLDEFRLTWNDIFTPNPPMLDLVRETSRPRILLSNTNEPHVTWIRERYPDIFPLFDHCVFSNEVRCRKPDARIYEHVQSVTGEAPEGHVFIDDVAEFVEGARAVGWQGIQFRDVEDVRQRLRALSGQA